MPKRFVEPPSADHGFWARWARTVTRRPLPIFLIGVVIVALVIYPAFHMNPSDAQPKNEPACGDAEAGRARSPRRDPGRRVPAVHRAAGRAGYHA